MTEKIIIAGAGGQGIMLLGKVLSEAASREGKFVTWLPSYGAEVRGGTAHCSLVISDEPIGSPYFNKADTLIVMNAPSLMKFSDRLNDNGVLFVNSSMVKQLPVMKNKKQKILRSDFTDIAAEIGNIKVANMVVLGFYLAEKNIVSEDAVISVMKDMSMGRHELLEINKEALLKGMVLV